MYDNAVVAYLMTPLGYYIGVAQENKGYSILGNAHWPLPYMK